jgi:hypothetical protein
VSLPVHKVRLYRCTNRANRDYYAFTCPACKIPTAQYADLHSAALLTARNVCSVLYLMPAEMSDPRRKDGPALTWDDVLDFIASDIDMDGVLSE